MPAVVCLVVAVTLVALSPLLRTLCRKRWALKAGLTRVAHDWLWQLPVAMGNVYFPDAEVRWPLPDEPTVWRGAQIVLVTEVGDGLVLDCLVSGATPEAPSGRVGQPLTLWTHRLDPPMPDATEGRGVVSAWTDAGTPVDIFCDHRGTSARVRICHGARTVSLALDNSR
jgi:hypothetical protein